MTMGAVRLALLEPSRWGSLGPVRAAFLGSLILSWIAHIRGDLVNRDGVIYLDAARTILEHGLSAVGQLNPVWMVFSSLVAGISALTGLKHETAAHVLNALFLAGSCGLLVAVTRRRMPEAAWAACLVALAMPAYNGYRDMVLREFGFWFFCLLALWLALRWQETQEWRGAIACQAALAVAACFRLEAIAFYPALMLWQLFSAPAGRRLRLAFMIGGIPLSLSLLGAALVAAGLLPLPGRLAYYLEAASPAHKLQAIQEAAQRMSESVLKHKYSREEAGYILVFGLLSVIPVKFVKMAGVFLVPLAYPLLTQPLRAFLARWQPLGWFFLAHAIVLAFFVTHEFFLVGRYVALLNLLAVPVAAAGLSLLWQRFPRWRAPIAALALLTLAANVISLSPPKTHIVEAGHWLAGHAPDPRRVGTDNVRIVYYAGWKSGDAQVLDRAGLAKALAERRLDLVAIEATRKDADAEDWLGQNGLVSLRRFTNKAGSSVILAAPADAGGAHAR